MTLRTLVLRFLLFSGLATIANLATQRLVLWFNDTSVFFGLALAAGTIVGLVLKYALDKRWIFGDVSTGVQAYGKKFLLYTAIGIVTTAIFWGTETAFWLVWETDFMREVGAVIGIGIGYLIKYNLDLRYVFTNGRLAQTK